MSRTVPLQPALGQGLSALAPAEVLDLATSFWSALVMLSTQCSLFVVGQWTSHLREWQPSISSFDVVLIISCLDAGVFLGFVPGSVYDQAGCKVVGFVGAVLSLLGYVGMYFVLQHEGDANVGILCLCGFIVGQGSIWSVTSCLNTVAGNFERADRGRAIGLLMSTLGLSAGVFSSLIVLFEGQSSEPSMLVVIGVAMAGISLISTAGIAKVPHGKLLTAEVGRTTLVLAMCMFALVLVTVRAISHPQVRGIPLLEWVIVPFYALVVVVQFVLVMRLVLRRGIRAIFVCELDVSVAGAFAGPDSPTDCLASPASLAELEGPTFGDALRSVDYWLLLFVFLVAIGVGQNLCNSIADIPAVSTASGVAMFAVGNCVGRFVPGYLSDIFSAVLDRPFFLLLSTIFLALSQGVMLIAGNNVLGVYFGIFLTSAAFGSFWVLVPAVEAEWFGRLNFGKIHGFLMFLGGECGLVVLYQGTHALAEHARGPCDEPGRVDACFSLKWWVCFGATCVAVLAAASIKVRLAARAAAAAVAVENVDMRTCCGRGSGGDTVPGGGTAIDDR